MPDNPNELLFKFFGVIISARGGVSFIVAVAVAVYILASAWRLIS